MDGELEKEPQYAPVVAQSSVESDDEDDTYVDRVRTDLETIKNHYLEKYASCTNMKYMRDLLYIPIRYAEEDKVLKSNNSILRTNCDAIVPAILDDGGHAAPFVLIKKDDIFHCFSLSSNATNGEYIYPFIQLRLSKFYNNINVILYKPYCFGIRGDGKRISLLTQKDTESCMAIAISTIVGFLKSPHAITKLYEEIEKAQDLRSSVGVEKLFEMPKDLAKYIQDNAAAEAIARGRGMPILPVSQLSKLGFERKESHSHKRRDLGVVMDLWTDKLSKLDQGPTIKLQKYEAMQDGCFDPNKWRIEKFLLRHMLKKNSDSTVKQWSERLQTRQGDDNMVVNKL